MVIKKVVVEKPRKGNFLASVSVQLEANGHRILIRDLRVLVNRRGETWLAFPAFSIPDAGRNFTYLQTVEVDTPLYTLISAAVLAEYEAWDAAQKQAGGVR